MARYSPELDRFMQQWLESIATPSLAEYMETQKMSEPDPNKVPCTLVWGSQNFSSTQTKLHIFALTPRSMKRKFVNQALEKTGPVQYSSAAKNGTKSAGQWCLQNLQASEGDVVLIQMMGTMKGMVARKGAIAFRFSRAGPPTIIEGKPIVDSQASVNKITVLQARGHVITKELLEELHYVGLHGFNFEEGAVDACFTVKQIGKGEELHVTEVTSSKFNSSHKVILPPKRRRRVRV